MKLNTVPFILIAFLAMVSKSGIAQIGNVALSPFQKIEQEIARNDITIEYSRPSIRGRVIFGDLVPYRKLWRTGANRNTKISFTEDVIIGGTRVKPGSYAIMSIPTEKEWTVYFYNETHHWDVPEDFSEEKVVAKIIVPTSKLNDTVYSFMILIENITNDVFDLTVMWENTKATIPIELITEETMSKVIAKTLAGPDKRDYYQAAKYRIESGRGADEALEWIDKSISMWGEKWFLLVTKAECHIDLGQKKEAQIAIDKGKEVTLAEGTEFGYGYFERLQKKLDKG